MKKRYFRISRTLRLLRFSIFGRHLGIQFPVMGRPQFFYHYNDGYSSFVDVGPLRLYRHRYMEASHPIHKKEK